MFKSADPARAARGDRRSAAGAAVRRVNRWRSTWGVDPAEVDQDPARRRPRAGPVAQRRRAASRSTRRPSAVWPWLVQMGYGRAGWYSYDQLDMQRHAAPTRSSRSWQSLAVGDIVPTHPGRRLRGPGRRARARARPATPTRRSSRPRRPRRSRERPATVPAGLAASGAFLRATPPRVRGELGLRPRAARRRPDAADRARPGLVRRPARRCRPSPCRSSGFGVFVMMQRQMLGIRDRAERLGRAARGRGTGRVDDRRPRSSEAIAAS